MTTQTIFKGNRKDEIFGFLLLLLAAILLVCLASYNLTDTPAHTSAPNSPVRNLAGIVGAYISEALLFTVGIAAYLLPLIILFWAWNTFWGKSANNVYTKICGLALMLVSVGALAHMLHLALHAGGFTEGGIMGLYASDLLTDLFGTIGAPMVALTVLIISLLLTTEFFVFSLSIVIGKATAKALVRIGKFTYNRISRRDELPGGLSLTMRKRPPKVEKTAKRLLEKER